MGRAPPTAVSVLLSVREAGWNHVHRLDEECAHEMDSELVQAQEKVHQEVLQRVTAGRQRSQTSSSSGSWRRFKLWILL